MATNNTTMSQVNIIKSNYWLLLSNGNPKNNVSIIYNARWEYTSACKLTAPWDAQTYYLYIANYAKFTAQVKINWSRDFHHHNNGGLADPRIIHISNKK